MKITERSKPIVLTIILFLILPCVLIFIATFFSMIVEQGLAGGGPYVGDILMTIANWPSFLLKIYPTVTTMHGTVVYDVERGLFSPLVITVNTIGWSSIGFIVGLIISVIKGRKRQRVSTDKNELNSQ